MKSIFELTKREQRIVIVIVAALVAIAFAKHLLENRSRPLPAESTPTSSPTVHTEEEQPDSDDSR
jgi:predicted metal-binding membrane protein